MVWIGTITVFAIFLLLVLTLHGLLRFRKWLHHPLRVATVRQWTIVFILGQIVIGCYGLSESPYAMDSISGWHGDVYDQRTVLSHSMYVILFFQSIITVATFAIQVQPYTFNRPSTFLQGFVPLLIQLLYIIYLMCIRSSWMLKHAHG